MEDEDNKSKFQVGGWVITGWKALIPVVIVLTLVVLGIIHLLEQIPVYH